MTIPAAFSDWPAVFVIVPLFNDNEALARCVNALDRQLYPGPMQIIVVDNASEPKVDVSPVDHRSTIVLHEPLRGHIARATRMFDVPKEMFSRSQMRTAFPVSNGYCKP